MLHRRLITSAFAIALLLLALWADFELGQRFNRPGIIASLILIICALVAADELRRMINLNAIGLSRPVVLTSVLMCVGFSCAPALGTFADRFHTQANLIWMMVGITSAFGWILISEILSYRTNHFALRRIEASCLIILYVGMLGFMIQIRLVQGNGWGIVALFSLLLTAKMSDSFAYLIGRAWGRTKMSPVLSPGKTVEGGISAVAFGCLGAAIALYPVSYWVNGSVTAVHWWVALAFGVAVTGAAILGDLAESLLKREVHFKDSGSLLPGMGGILDSIDSLIGAAPVAYFFWAMGWIGAGFPPA